MSRWVTCPPSAPISTSPRWIPLAVQTTSDDRKSMNSWRIQSLGNPLLLIQIYPLLGKLYDENLHHRPVLKLEGHGQDTCLLCVFICWHNVMHHSDSFPFQATLFPCKRSSFACKALYVAIESLGSFNRVRFRLPGFNWPISYQYWPGQEYRW